MLSNIFDFLERVKAGLTKPDGRITVEVYDMGNGDGLKFQFLWYEDKLLKISCFVPNDMIEAVYDDQFIVEYIVHMANFEVEKYYKEQEKST